MSRRKAIISLLRCPWVRLAEYVAFMIAGALLAPYLYGDRIDGALTFGTILAAANAVLLGRQHP